MDRKGRHGAISDINYLTGSRSSCSRLVTIKSMYILQEPAYDFPALNGRKFEQTAREVT
jgi:hypothetical protein